MAKIVNMKLELEPYSVIEADLGIQSGGPMHKFFTNTCYKHMDKYTPYQNGGLAYDDVTIGIDEIVYDSPYAHYMYEGKVMGPNIPIKENGNIVGWFSRGPKYYTGDDINYHLSAGHEYAGPYWDERMWSAEQDDVIKEVQKMIEKVNDLASK